MAEGAERSDTNAAATPMLPPLRLGLLLGAAALAVVLWGGYGRHWSWTGINGSTATLWDWLHLLLLPAAFGVLPIWLSRSTRLARHHKLVGMTAVALFALLVVVGYVVPWAWTGFTGNKLWDWLELLALPLAVALTPIYGEIREIWSSRHSLLAIVGLTVFVGIVIGGYVGNWGWTGFRGNTLWDWLHLLLLPLLLPTVVVPALRPVASARLVSTNRAEATPAPADSLTPAGGTRQAPGTTEAENRTPPGAAAVIRSEQDSGGSG